MPLPPVLRQQFDLPEMQVHLFMLYFACLSAITPPVAVANFAAGVVATVSPRLDLTTGAALVGAAVLLGVWRLGRRARRPAPAR